MGLREGAGLVVRWGSLPSCVDGGSKSALALVLGEVRLLLHEDGPLASSSSFQSCMELDCPLPRCCEWGVCPMAFDDALLRLDPPCPSLLVGSTFRFVAIQRLAR